MILKIHLHNMSNKINEEGVAGSTGGLTAASNAGGTNTFSVLGATNSPTFGGFIGPLSRISKDKLNKRLLWRFKGAKNSDNNGLGKVVKPPQGFYEEYIYSSEGNLVTESDLKDWFGADLDKKPSFNGGKIVMIEPKCLAFPYCSQGAADKPIRLIGENKDGMCESCYSFCESIAAQAGKDANYIAKIIREKYLKD
jgi:hypothetical protein